MLSLPGLHLYDHTTFYPPLYPTDGKCDFADTLPTCLIHYSVEIDPVLLIDYLTDSTIRS